MNEPSGYFEYLQRRSWLGWIYRKYWLYPALSRHLSGHVLDVGCGIGDFLRFRRDAVGVDINPLSVDWCRSQGMDAHVMELDVLPFSGASFDGVMLDNVLEHLLRPEALLAEIARVLRCAGVLIVGVPGERGYSRDPDHKQFYSEDSLIQRLHDAGFRCDKVLHMPLRSAWLARSMSQYCIYGIFRLDKPRNETSK